MPAMNRRRFIGSTAAAAAAAYPLSTTSEASTMGAYWCIGDTTSLDTGWAAYTAALEQKLGRGFAGVRLNGGFTGANVASQTNLSTLAKDVNAGRHWVYLNGKPSPPGGAYAGYWADVAAGRYDAAFRSLFSAIMASSTFSSARPVHYSFHHEQTSTSEEGGIIPGTAADYGNAWSHVMRLMRSVGAHVSTGGKMLSCWVPEWSQISRDPAYAVSSKKPSANVSKLLATKILATLDTTLLDHVGADIYCTTTSTCSPDDQWTPLHRLGIALGKPIITGETGIAGSDTKVVGYLKQLDTLLHAWGTGDGPGQLHAICWTSRVASGGDYRMDATSARLAQYRAMAQDALYARTLA